MENDSGPACGVYLLFKRKRLVYVGRSKNPYARIETHRRNGRAFDYSVAIPCPAGDVDWIERAMIEALNPPQNRLGVAAPREEHEPDVVQIVKHVHVQAAPAGRPPRDPHLPLGLREARSEVADYRLGDDFDAAVRSGELRSIPRNPAIDRPGARRLVTVGDLEAWRAKKLAERAAMGFRTGT